MKVHAIAVLLLMLSGLANEPGSQPGDVRADSSECKCPASPLVDWFACGFVPFDGYEGWLNQHGALSCDDGTMVCLVDDQYTSANAAAAELDAVMAGRPTQGTSLAIRQVSEVDNAHVLELAEPRVVHANRELRFAWVVVWVENTSLWSAYGCDRESAVRLFRDHQAGGTR